MEKLFYYNCAHYIANVFVLLLFFATNGESTLLNKRKRIETEKSTSATTSSHRVYSDNKLMRECFADFLILQTEERTKMRGKGNKEQFVLDPPLVDRENLRLFMQANEGKTAELWNCVDRARPFQNNNNGVKSGRSGNEIMTDLMDIFRNEITRMGLIAPSDKIQMDLHNAQCLLDLGVIEGKILMEKPANSEQQYVPGEESEWFQELKEFGKNHQKIVFSTEGEAYLDECLHRDKPLADKMAAKRQKLNEHLLSLLDSIDREKLVKIISKLVPFSDWLLKQIGPNQRQKQCFADFFLWECEGTMAEQRGQKFVVKKRYFGKRDRVIELANEEDTEFVDCLKSAIPFLNHLLNPKHVDNLVHEFYDHNFSEVVPSPNMQKKLHNAQCWLDLGAVEGKISMELIQPGAHFARLKDEEERRAPWLEELESDQPIVISTEGANHLNRCLRKGKIFKAKLTRTATEHQRHLQLRDPVEWGELLELIGQIYHSELLNKEIFYEQNCVADFLVKHWHVQTRLDYFHTDSLTPAKLWRFITWSDLLQNGRSIRVHLGDNAKEFATLEICLIRKGALLKLDAQGKQYIDLEPLFRLMGNSLFTTQLLTEELNTQSHCLANFLATRYQGQQCLLKKRRGPIGEPLTNHLSGYQSPYIINYDTEGAYALSAEQCHLPEGKTGIYSEDSVKSKEREDFKQLWDCGVRMTTTTEQEGGGKAIDVRAMLKIHTPKQLYLRGNIMKIFFSTIEKLAYGEDDMCPICHEKYGQNHDHIVVSRSRCKHKYHSDCMHKWLQMQDSCPMCRTLIINAVSD